MYNLCTPCLFSSLLSRLQSFRYNLPGRNTCSGSWPVNWAPQQMPSCSDANESRQKPASWEVSYCALAPDHSKWEWPNTPLLFWNDFTATERHYITVFIASSPRNIRVYNDLSAADRVLTSQVYLSRLEAEGRDRTCLLVLCPVELYQPRKEGLMLVCTKESSRGQGFPGRHPWGAREVPGDTRNAVQTQSRNERPAPRLTHFYSSNSQVT